MATIKLLSGVTLEGSEAETYLRGQRILESTKVDEDTINLDGRDPPWGSVKNPRIAQLMRDVDMLGRMIRTQAEELNLFKRWTEEKINRLWAADPEDQADSLEALPPDREYPVPGETIDAITSLLTELVHKANPSYSEARRANTVIKWLRRLKEFHQNDT